MTNHCTCSEYQDTYFVQLPAQLQDSQPQDEKRGPLQEFPGHSCHVAVAVT